MTFSTFSDRKLCAHKAVAYVRENYIAHKGRLSASAHACNTGKNSKRNININIFKVMLCYTADLKELSVTLAALLRNFHC